VDRPVRDGRDVRRRGLASLDVEGDAEEVSVEPKESGVVCSARAECVASGQCGVQLVRRDGGAGDRPLEDVAGEGEGAGVGRDVARELDGITGAAGSDESDHPAEKTNARADKHFPPKGR
jgi:hypothetical protein